ALGCSDPSRRAKVPPRFPIAFHTHISRFFMASNPIDLTAVVEGPYRQWICRYFTRVLAWMVDEGT
ncbi:MAG: hypothetical protein WA002_18030, partial [Candidatus Acidiferrales bacterium]